MLTAFLDLAVCPVSYDAVVLMAQAEMERRKLGLARLHVVIVGEVRKKPQYDEAEAEWRLWNIVIPAARLFGATVTLAADWHQAELLKSPKPERNWPPDWREQNLKTRRHLIGGVIERVARGEEVSRITASEHARSAARAIYDTARKIGWKVVTMTRRETYLPERNSDRMVWNRAMHDIGNRSAVVWNIEDTATALVTGQGFGELNLDLRMAMYQEADFNVVANCGPASLCWFSEKPYVMVGAGFPADEWDGLFVKQGLPLGASWPWALPNQRLAYRKETAGQIVAEFDRWVSATR